MRTAKTQISLSICPVWSESSQCAMCVAKNPSFLHADSEDSDQTGQMPRLIWVFTGRTCYFVYFVVRWLSYFWCFSNADSMERKKTTGKNKSSSRSIREKSGVSLTRVEKSWKIIYFTSNTQKKRGKWLRMLIFSALNGSSSDHHGFESSSDHMWDKPKFCSRVVRWFFSGISHFPPTLWNNLDRP